VNPYPWFYSGEPSKDIKERWQWTFPICLLQGSIRSASTCRRSACGCTDGRRRDLVAQLSGDLTRHAPETQEKSGGPITGDMNGPEVYGVIFSVGPASGRRTSSGPAPTTASCT
jgi:hypothetical protein